MTRGCTSIRSWSLEDGRYELQVYDRTLTDIGLDIKFQRIVDGEVMRQITGTTARANIEPKEAVGKRVALHATDPTAGARPRLDLGGRPAWLDPDGQCWPVEPW